MVGMTAPIFERIRTEIPNDQQVKFFNSKALHTLYGGARGGGKTWASRRKAVLMCMRYPNLKGLVVRETFRELTNNYIRPLCEELNGYAKYKDSEKCFFFPNGSTLQLGYCACDADVNTYQGAEYDFIVFEESTNLAEEWVKRIATSLRTTREDFRPRVMYTCNPGGRSHAYFKRLFIDRVYYEHENPDDYLFIPATVQDNAVLMRTMPEYIKQLEALPEAIRRAHLYGDWDVYDGAYFSEFRAEPKPYKEALNTHVCEPFEIPDNWRIYRSMDWGYSRPFDISWWACDHDGRAFLILQLYGCATDTYGNPLPNTGVKWTADQVFAEVEKIEREHRWLRGKRIVGVADPSIWAENGGRPIIASADDHKIYFEKGDNSRIAGWMQIRQRFKFDEEGRPMVYFFSTCKHAIRTIPLLQFSQTNVEDLDTSMEDHFADSFRYFAQTLCPMEEEVVTERVNSPLSPLKNKTRYERYIY